ncbi:hypothetical protein [Prescottella equi]
MSNVSTAAEFYNILDVVQVEEARTWLADCGYDTEGLTDLVVLDMVERHYAGGLAAFDQVTDCLVPTAPDFKRPDVNVKHTKHFHPRPAVIVAGIVLILAAVFGIAITGVGIANATPVSAVGSLDTERIDFLVDFFHIEEDSPFWICEVMGNRICGPTN